MSEASAKSLPYRFAVVLLSVFAGKNGARKPGTLLFTSKPRVGQSSADVVKGIVRDHGKRLEGVSYVVLECKQGFGNGVKDGATAAAILARTGNLFYTEEGKRQACPAALKAIAATHKPAKPAEKPATAAPTTRKPAQEPVAAEAATVPAPVVEPTLPKLSPDAIRAAVDAMRNGDA